MTPADKTEKLSETLRENLVPREVPAWIRDAVKELRMTFIILQSNSDIEYAREPKPEELIAIIARHAPKDARVSELTSWQPIATAPRDGTRVLTIGHPFADPANGYYLPATSEWDGEGWSNIYGDGYFLWPTHWQPLPAAPGKEERT